MTSHTQARDNLGFGDQPPPGYGSRLQTSTEVDTHPTPYRTDMNQCLLSGASILGIILTVLGSIVVILQIILLDSHWTAVQYTAAGIWGGVLTIITGVFGILVGIKKTQSYILAFTTLSGLCAFTILFPFGTSMAATRHFEITWTGVYPKRSVPEDQLVQVIMMGFFCLVIFVCSVTSASLGCCPSCNVLPTTRQAPANPTYDVYHTPDPRGMQYQIQGQAQV